MKKIVIATGLLVSTLAFSQQQETFEKKGKVLIFTNHDPNLNQDTKNGLVKTFFKVYPKLVKDFNPKSTDTIRVKIDTEYDGVAYAHNGRITISSDWLEKKPGDIDVITHEVMHIVRADELGIQHGGDHENRDEQTEDAEDVFLHAWLVVMRRAVSRWRVA